MSFCPSDSRSVPKTKTTAGYTFAHGGKLAVVIFTKPGDSGLECYFFDRKDLADACLPAFSSFAPGLRAATVVESTLQEVRELAGKSGASIRRISNWEHMKKELGG